MKKNTARKAPLRKVQQEQSTLSIWLWLVGGMVLLALLFALLEVLFA